MEITKEFLQERPLSYSSLTAFKQSPAHYIHYLTQPFTKTPALVLGNLVDVLLLTPDNFAKKFAVVPECDKRTKEGKAIWEAFKSNPDHAGKEWVPTDMYNQAIFMRDAVNMNPVSASFLKRMAKSQLKLNWTCKETGLPLVCFIDIEGDTFIADLKTTDCADPEEFMRSAFNYQYHIQAAAYLEAYKRKFFKFPDYYFIVVEKSAPFGVSVCKATDDFIALGKQEFEGLKTRFNYCMEKNLWQQTYEFKAAALDGVHQLDLPGYAKLKLEK